MLSSAQKSRTDTREAVSLRAQLIDSNGSRNVSVSEVSTRGLLGTMAHPPARGEFITIIFPNQEVAGQVRWVKGQSFGVTLRERIDARHLTSGQHMRRQPAKPVQSSGEPDRTNGRTIIAYAAMGLAVLFAACLIVTILS